MTVESIQWLESPESAPTLAHILQARAVHQPGEPAYSFFSNQTEQDSLTYEELAQWSCAIRDQISEVSREGDNVLLVLVPGLEFIATLYGCMLAGVTVVPAYPPVREGEKQRLQIAAQDSRARVALCDTLVASAVAALLPDVEVVVCDRDVGSDLSSEPVRAESESNALIQYTSGSTGQPRGVVLTHRNLMANQEMIRKAARHGQDTRWVSWLPPYHDMGLIGTIMQPLFVGAPCALMSPTEFVQRPLSWLELMSQFRGTASGAPNFAYELCARRASGQDLALDLSSWEVAFNGAEPVQSSTLRRFAATFAPYGFREANFLPCYGLAEATLLVTAPATRHSPQIKRLAQPDLTAGTASEVDAEQPGVDVVSVGMPWGQRVEIVDAMGHAQVEGTVGEIVVSGPNVAAGYWTTPSGAEGVFEPLPNGIGRLKTGDLGFVIGHELFVTGRVKDAIVVRGRNYFPNDLERTAERSHEDLRPGGVAAFAVTDNQGPERVVLVQEVRDESKADCAEIIEAIRAAIADEHGISLDDVILVSPRCVPRTTSGKVRRAQCRDMYLAGQLHGARFEQAKPATAVVAEPDSTRGFLRNIRGFLGKLATYVPSRRAAAAGSLARKLAAVPEQEQQGVVLEVVRSEVAIVLGHSSAEAVDPERAFKELGFDSLAAVELRNRLSVVTGLRLPATMVFDYPTPNELAGYLKDEAVPGIGKYTELDPTESEIRKALAAIPLARLRQAGLMGALLDLAQSDDETSLSDGKDEANSIDAMDVASLVRKAFGNGGSMTEAEDRNS